MVNAGENVQAWSVVTEAIAFRMMGAGIGEITAENTEEFFIRCRLLDDLLTADEVLSHVGMTTNVTYESWAKFTRRVLDSQRLDYAREFTQATRTKEKA